MPPPLDPDLRAAILADIQAIADGATPERSAGSIADEHGIACSTVTRIAKAAGLDHVWQRTQTAHASRAKAVDNRARRAALSERMLEDAERLRQRVWQPAEVITSTGVRCPVELPIAADVRQFVSAVTALVKASLEVDAKDSQSEQHAVVDQWLREMIGDEEP